MDHLPKIRDATQRLPRVPYLGDPRFGYEGPFNTFNKSLAKLLSRTDENVSRHDLSSFIQSWLFFGLLKKYFRVWGLPILTTDFLTTDDSGTSVTLAVLSEYLIATNATERQVYQKHRGDDKLSGTSSRDLDAGRGRRRKVLDVLDEAYEALSFLEKDVHHCLPEIWDSVILLAATLSRAAEILYKPPKEGAALEVWPTNDFGRFRLRSITDFRDNERWCVHERRTISELVDERLPELAFFTQYNRHEALSVSHNGCKAHNSCVAYQITDEAAYRIQHVTKGCACEYVGFETGEVPTEQEDEPTSTSSSRSLAKSALSILP